MAQMNMSRRKILMVYFSVVDSEEYKRLSITQHLSAIEQYSDHEVLYWNAYEGTGGWQSVYNLTATPMAPPEHLASIKFDAVILHNTFLCFRWMGSHFFTLKKRYSWLADFKCPKIALPQDEYDHSELLDDWLFEWNISAVFSLYGEKAAILYPKTFRSACFYKCLPGYIDDKTLKDWDDIVPHAQRRQLVGYRARHLPFWFGQAGQLKHLIAEATSAYCESRGYKCDVSTREEDVIVGSNWLRFLESSRCVVGSEGGASAIDWRGELRAMISLLRRQGKTTFEEVSANLYGGWDSYSFLSMTPRHFESIIAGTCQILIEGEYDGILIPEEHYIPIRGGLENIGEAIEQARDVALTQKIARNVYFDIARNPTYYYSSFCRQITNAIGEVSVPKKSWFHFGGGKSAAKLELADLKRDVIREQHEVLRLHAESGLLKDENRQLQTQIAELKKDIEKSILAVEIAKSSVESELRIAYQKIEYLEKDNASKEKSYYQSIDQLNHSLRNNAKLQSHVTELLNEKIRLTEKLEQLTTTKSEE